MTHLRGRDVLFALTVLLLAPSATSWAQQRPAIAEKMAKTHGLDSFGQVEGIRYTFNVARPDGNNVARSWEWNPKTDAVSYEGKDKDGKPVKVTYRRSQPGMPEDIDATFLNPVLAVVAFSRDLGHERDRDRRGHAEAASREWIWREAGREIPVGRRLFAR